MSNFKDALACLMLIVFAASCMLSSELPPSSRETVAVLGSALLLTTAGFVCYFGFYWNRTKIVLHEALLAIKQDGNPVAAPRIVFVAGPLTIERPAEDPVFPCVAPGAAMIQRSVQDAYKSEHGPPVNPDGVVLPNNVSFATVRVNAFGIGPRVLAEAPYKSEHQLAGEDVRAFRGVASVTLATARPLSVGLIGYVTPSFDIIPYVDNASGLELLLTHWVFDSEAAAPAVTARAIVDAEVTDAMAVSRALRTALSGTATAGFILCAIAVGQTQPSSISVALLTAAAIIASALAVALYNLSPNSEPRLSPFIYTNTDKSPGARKVRNLNVMPLSKVTPLALPTMHCNRGGTGGRC